MLKHCYKSSEGAGQITVGFFFQRKISVLLLIWGGEKKGLTCILPFACTFILSINLSH